MDAIVLVVVKDLAHLIVDKELQVLTDEGISKLPAQYQAILKGAEGFALPQVISFLDAKIDAIK